MTVHLVMEDGSVPCGHVTVGELGSLKVQDTTCTRCLTAMLLHIHNAAEGLWNRLEELAYAGTVKAEE